MHLLPLQNPKYASDVNMPIVKQNDGTWVEKHQRFYSTFTNVFFSGTFCTSMVTRGTVYQKAAMDPNDPKRVARVCQHQLSFLFPLATYAALVSTAGDSDCWRCSTQRRLKLPESDSTRRTHVLRRHPLGRLWPGFDQIGRRPSL